ncbi:MAG: NAD(P)/FAD-dependent oxidoreductase, partial [Actinomycetota bacterium]
VRGEPTITATGLEGGPVYALNPELRAGHELVIDLQPDLDVDTLTTRLADRRRPKDSVSTWLRRVGLAPVAVAVMRDATDNALPVEPAEVATLAKAVPITVDRLASIDRAISTAGGVATDAVDETGMLVDRPGTWIAGEMLAWDAPTGGYLIQACLSTGRRAGLAAARWASDRG